jgi:hypothetical protein
MSTIPSLGQESAFGRGQPNIARQVMAKRIIELAREGERNPDRLCERVLAAMDICDGHKD